MTTPRGSKTGLVMRPGSPRRVGDKTGLTGGAGAGPGITNAPPELKPSSSTVQGGNRTSITTYFTKVPVPGDQPQFVYGGDRIWAKVTVTLETAGPVAVGNSSQLAPVLSGKGALLDTGVPMTFSLARGVKLYIASTSVNRVKVVVEPLPWLEQITGIIGKLFEALTGKRA